MKRIMSIFLIVILAVCLCGCEEDNSSKREQLEDRLSELDEQYQAAVDEYDRLVDLRDELN